MPHVDQPASIVFACHECGQAYKRPAQDAGKKGPCTKCGVDLIVPAKSQEQVEAALSAQKVPPLPARQPPTYRRIKTLHLVLVACGALALGALGGWFGVTVKTAEIEEAQRKMRYTRWSAVRPDETWLRPSFEEVCDRLIYPKGSPDWKFQGSSDAGVAEEDPSDIEIRIKRVDTPIMLALDGPVWAIRSITAVIGPVEWDHATGRKAEAEASRSLALAAGVPLKEIRDGFDKYRFKLSKGKSGEGIVHPKWNLALTSWKNEGEKEVEVTATVYLKEPEKQDLPPPKNGLAKVERNFSTSTSSWVAEADRSYRHDDGVSVYFEGPPNEPTGMIISYPTDREEAKHMGSVAWAIVAVIGNGDGEILANIERLDDWGESPTKELELIGGTMHAAVFEHHAILRITADK